ncbi:MAG: curli assembly protein CsgE [uncultured bacterium]|nr:MAG: curli assembly protein CsgE [uncultured bacterium]
MKNSILINVIIFFVLVFSVSLTHADSRDVEIDGLIIDQTKSKMGHDFASNFSLFWETLEVGYNIVIDEQSEPRGGGWISIEINGNLAFRGLLKPNSEEIENLAKEAVSSCNEFLVSQHEASANLQQEQDIKGDGIH